MNRILIIITILFISSSLVSANPNIQARTAILVDYNSDEILYEFSHILQYCSINLEYPGKGGLLQEKRKK